MHLIHHALHWMQVIQTAGWVGWLMFVGLYAACCVFFMPASVLTLAAGVVYGFWGGTLLVLVGNGIGALACLFITRYVFRGWVQRQVAGQKKLQAMEKAVQKEGWKIVFLTRLSPIMPFSLINYALGLTKISPWHFLVATEIGSIPATAIYVYCGTLMGNLAKVGVDVHRHGPTEWIVRGGALVLTILVTIYLNHRVSKTLKEKIR
jgi:uncharacterized membrane protein YdjX (TVP38/TMEM64 family)